MEIFYWPKFAKQFKKLLTETKELALKKEQIFRNNPFDPRLKTHKLHGELNIYWSFSVDYNYRIIFRFIGDNTVRFYSVGNHDIYE